MFHAVRFDTRNKKPKLYWLLIPIAAAALAIGLLVRADADRNAFAICCTAAALYLVIAGGLLHALRGQLRYNPYSYNTIYYAGFSLFMLFIFAAHVLLAFRIHQQPETYRASMILHILLGSAMDYMFLSSPFLLVFSAALCLSNIALIRHEGRRVVNLLGIFLSVLIVAGEVGVYCYDYYTSGSQFEVMIHDIITNLAASVFLYFECMLIGAIFANALVVRYKPEPDKDFLIVLGCGIRKDGTPTPLLRGRIDRAIAFAREQQAQTGKMPIFLTSGGQGADEVIAESACMKQYLIEQGIPQAQIIEENRSTNTAENMRFSKQIIDSINPDAKIAFSTTNYHVFRSGIFARRVKMRAVGIGAKTKWYFWPNAAVREFVGLLTKHRLKQSLILGGMVAAYILMTLIAYR